MALLWDYCIQVSKNIIVSNKKFKNVNNILSKLGYIVEEVEYSNIAKMGGLFRCTTLPLIRSWSKPHQIYFL